MLGHREGVGMCSSAGARTSSSCSVAVRGSELAGLPALAAPGHPEVAVPAARPNTAEHTVSQSSRECKEAACSQGAALKQTVRGALSYHLSSIQRATD